jgi:superoxide oxidase
VYYALYGLLFATPLLGMATMAWSHAAWRFLAIPLPHVASPDRALSHELEDIHKTLGNLLMYLAIVHATVGLYHHFVRRDNALQRLLPPVREGIG